MDVIHILLKQGSLIETKKGLNFISNGNIKKKNNHCAATVYVLPRLTELKTAPHTECGAVETNRQLNPSGTNSQYAAKKPN